MQYTLKPSYIFLIFLISAHVLNLVVLEIWVDLPRSLKFILFSLGCFSFYYYLNRFFLFTKSYSVIKIWRREKKWQILQKNHEILTLELKTNSIFCQFFVLLNLKTKEKKRFIRRSVLVFPDSLTKEGFRKLRVEASNM